MPSLLDSHTPSSFRLQPPSISLLPRLAVPLAATHAITTSNRPLRLASTITIAAILDLAHPSHTILAHSRASPAPSSTHCRPLPSSHLLRAFHLRRTTLPPHTTSFFLAPIRRPPPWLACSFSPPPPPSIHPDRRHLRLPLTSPASDLAHEPSSQLQPRPRACLLPTPHHSRAPVPDLYSRVLAPDAPDPTSSTHPRPELRPTHPQLGLLSLPLLPNLQLLPSLRPSPCSHRRSTASRRPTKRTSPASPASTLASYPP